MLEKKSKESLKNYGQHLVIGNLLHNHKDYVVLFPKQSINSGNNMKPITIIRSEKEIIENIDIEKKLVEEIVKMHNQYLNNHSI